MYHSYVMWFYKCTYMCIPPKCKTVAGEKFWADLVNLEQFAKILPTKIFIIKLLVDYSLIEKNTQQMNIKQVHLYLKLVRECGQGSAPRSAHHMDFVLSPLQPMHLLCNRITQFSFTRKFCSVNASTQNIFIFMEVFPHHCFALYDI